MRPADKLAEAFFRSFGMRLGYGRLRKGRVLCEVLLEPSDDALFVVTEPVDAARGWNGYVQELDAKGLSGRRTAFADGAGRGWPAECGRTRAEAAEKLLLRIQARGWDVAEWRGLPSCSGEAFRCDRRCGSCQVGRSKVREFSLPGFSSLEELDIRLSASGL